jgi:DinB superfamily/Pentapeptide repeats (8 copies)
MSESNEFDSADLTGARFRKVRLTGARFRMVDLTEVVMRDVSLVGASIDGSEIDGLRIDGVEIAPLVEAELTRRQPERAWRNATDPAGLREAWEAIRRSWAATYERVAALPPGSVDIRVEDEWSFAQTLRHLVFATDGWLGAVQTDRRNDQETRAEQTDRRNDQETREAPPFHPWGLPFSDLPEFLDGPVTDLGIDPAATPSYAEVLEVRAGRVARVTDFLAGVSPERLAEECVGPVWEGGERLTVQRCLRVIFNEECEHHRFARRDLDVIEAAVRPAATAGVS